MRVPDEPLHHCKQGYFLRSWAKGPPVAERGICFIQQLELNPRGRRDHVKEIPGRNKRGQNELNGAEHENRALGSECPQCFLVWLMGACAERYGVLTMRHFYRNIVDRGGSAWALKML